jgi:hypothetical protein
LILAAAGAWCRVEAFAARHTDLHRQRFLTRVLDSTQRVSGAVWATALSVDEKTQLTVRIYDEAPALKADGNDLFEIESVLFAKHLPPPPARILVGACGSGREAVALAAQGYRIDAFDPAQGCAAESRRRLGGRACVRRLSYEQLSAIVLDGGDADPLRQDRFDAVVLGCGSLSHVLDEREQRRLLRALHALCPSGPILASFLWVKEQAAGTPVGRAVRLGNRIGHALARLRGMPPGDDRHMSYRARRGFAYTFSQREFEDLALAADRRVVWERDGARSSPYATLLPIEAGA